MLSFVKTQVQFNGILCDVFDNIWKMVYISIGDFLQYHSPMTILSIMEPIVKLIISYLQFWSLMFKLVIRFGHNNTKVIVFFLLQHNYEHAHVLQTFQFTGKKKIPTEKAKCCLSVFQLISLFKSQALMFGLEIIIL